MLNHLLNPSCFDGTVSRLSIKGIIMIVTCDASIRYTRHMWNRSVWLPRRLIVDGFTR